MSKLVGKETWKKFFRPMANFRKFGFFSASTCGDPNHKSIISKSNFHIFILSGKMYFDHSFISSFIIKNFLSQIS